MGQNISLIERLVTQHTQGVVPETGVLDTDRKVQNYVSRMKEATADGLQENRRARRDSELMARTRRVD